MINSKKIKLIIAFVSLLVSFNFIQETYAKYVKTVTGDAQMAVARWRILVNNENIRTGSLAASTITPVFSGNANIASNVIAPLSTGYFDIIIDSGETDVSFTYSISSVVNANSDVTDLVTTGYSINDGAINNFTTYNTPITGTITHGTATPTSIRVYVMWNDDALTATMNNAQDTDATYSTNANATLDVSLTFTQYNG